MCNNAGVESGAPFSEIPLAMWEWVLRVNFWGVLYGCRTFLPLLRKQGEGHIVNTASTALVDGGVHPVALLLSPGQAGDNPRLVPLLDGLAAAGHRPAHLLGDKAYSHPSIRRRLRQRRIRHTIPERRDQVERRQAKGSAGGRPPKFDAELYRQRNTVERSFDRHPRPPRLRDTL